MLQHPDEASNSKGSAIIAELGLQQYSVWVGEDFTEHTELKRIISQEGERTAVMYPSGSALTIPDDIDDWQPETLIIIDATWRKASRIWQLNPQLHSLKALTFADDAQSEYRIRKAPEKGYLSTVECIVKALRCLEGDKNSYQSLLELFRQMIDFQIEKMGNETFRKNYKEKSGEGRN